MNSHTISQFNLTELTPWKKSRMLSVASQVLEAQQQMSEEGKNILHHTLQQKERHISKNHYPKGDRIDYNTGAQYFYHCHRENLESMEHGHFHCFMRYKNIPKSVKPTPLFAAENYTPSPMTHLVAIAMNRFGQPIRLFTVNRWVSSEIWYDAKHVSSFTKRFKMTLIDDPYWQVLDKWIEGMLHLFIPQITWLHQVRDQNIQERQAHSHNVYEDRNLEELSEISIDLSQQINWLIE